MTVTVNMVLDILSGYPVKTELNPELSFAFQRMEFLSEQGGEPDSAVLYLGSVAQVKNLPAAAAAQICVVCSGKTAAVERLLQTRAVNLLVLPAETELFAVANLLMNSFRRLAQWENELNSAMLAGANLQTIAEIGGRAFGDNPTVLGSNSYNIVGRSVMETPYNETVSAILHRGYFLKEEADTLSRMGYLTHREDYRDAMLVNPPTYVGCPFFLGTFPASLKRASFIAVYFVKGTPTAGMLDLFRSLAVRVQSYCESLEKDGAAMPSALEMFMDDLLMHTHDDELYLIDRARQLQLPPNETYRLGMIQWEEYSRDQAEYVLWRIRYGFSFPVFRVMRYHDSVLMVLKGSFTKTLVNQRVNDALSEASDVLSVCGGHIGFSTEVDSLLRLDVAYRQACAALKFGRRLAPEEKLYFYSTYYIYDMIEAYADRFQPEDMYVQKLRKLDNSEEGRYNNLHLLRYYLLSERSLSVTSRLLHLHRNSIIYRLGKIEDILGVDLDDPEVRLRLLISFKMMEYLKGQRLPAMEDGKRDEAPESGE